MSSVDVVLRDRSSSQEALAGVVDIVVHGVNITARAGKTQGLTLLAELCHAVSALRRGRLERATTHLCSDGESWELGLECDGPHVLLSVFRSGPCPEVAIHERPVLLSELHEALQSAVDQALASGLPTGHRSILSSASEQLTRSRNVAKPLSRGIVQDRVVVRAGALEFCASAAFRVSGPAASDTDQRVERADLHALLLPGRFQIKSGRRSVSLSRAQLFLLAERLIWLAEDSLDSWQAARPLFRRLQMEGIKLGVRRGPGDAPVALSMGQAAGEGGAKMLTLSDLPTIDFVEGVARFAQALAGRISDHDARQATNLRLTVLIESARVVADRLSELRLDDARTNGERESYKSYGLPSVVPQTTGTWSQAGAMRFVPRWVAAVPHIDLRSTFLLQDKLIVGSAREVACLSPKSGDIAWRIHSDRAATVPTPLGLARLHADGRLRVHDLACGAVRTVTRLRPRAGGGAAGALVNTPGLPQLLLVAEGERSITAVDLSTGDIRWRYNGTRPATYRLRRAGRLVLVSGGDSALTALDVTSGELVWKVRDRLPFSGAISVRGDSAFALSSSSGGNARLHHIDLWSGETKWTSNLDELPLPESPPLLTDQAVIVPTRDRRGVGAVSLGRDAGEVLWDMEPGDLGPMSSWFALPDSVIANSSVGTITCLEAATGEVRYSHVFSRQLEGDQPRRLDPILQNGALFVPQHQVQVLRPATGELIGEVPCDLIADLLRVDSQCNVFIAEESGHLAAFSVAPKLQLVT